MLSYPLQARGLTAPTIRGMMANDHWTKRSVLALVFGFSALCWVGVAEIVNVLY
jgi:hypothetical protein